MTNKKWLVGYAMIDAYNCNHLNYEWLKEKAIACETFILGIPNDEVFHEIFGDRNEYSAEYAKKYWNDVKWVDSVIILDRLHLDYKTVAEEMHLSVCFCGSIYGKRYYKDREKLKSMGVELLPLLPNSLRINSFENILLPVIKESFWNKKIVLFGTGKYFDVYMNIFGKKYKPEYAVDNDFAKWNTSKEGIRITLPEELKKEDSNQVMVILCARDYVPLLEQLQTIGNFEFRSMLYYGETAALEEEVQCTHIDEFQKILEKVQKVNYDMLRVFDEMCRKYNIEYFLNYGSLLGALRHQAIIPWDNDVDVVMKRWEADKIIEHKNEFKDPYFWLGNDILGKKKYFDCINRFCYKDAYINMDEERDRYYENYYNSIHFDMFLIDKTYDNFWGKLQRFELGVLYGLMNAYRHESLFADYNEKMKKQNKILCFWGKFIPLPWLKKRADRVARRFDNDKNAPYYFYSNDTIRMLNMPFPAEIFDHAVDVPFGDITSKIACEGDRMCRMIFGDYMQLPPVEQRIPHVGRMYMTADSYVFEEPERGQFQL